MFCTCLFDANGLSSGFKHRVIREVITVEILLKKKSTYSFYIHPILGHFYNSPETHLVVCYWSHFTQVHGLLLLVPLQSSNNQAYNIS